MTMSFLEHSTLQSASQPGSWFKLQSHVNDSKASKALCRFRARNDLLGNRYKDRYGCIHVWCPWCMDRGVQGKLSENHVVSAQCRSFSISEFLSTKMGRGVGSIKLVLRAYLWGGWVK